MLRNAMGTDEENNVNMKDKKLTNKLGDLYRFQRYRSYVIPTLSWSMHTDPAMRLFPTIRPSQVEMMPQEMDVI